MSWDEKNYVLYNKEENICYKEKIKRIHKKLNKYMQCTACRSQINIDIKSKVFTHPVLGVLTCKKCSEFYGKGEFQKDEDGFDEFCRWCANGGNIVLCDDCTNGFCKKCISFNLGKNAVQEITASEGWKCFVCSITPLMKLRLLHRAILDKLRDSHVVEKSLTRKRASNGKEKNLKLRSSSRNNYVNKFDNNMTSLSSDLKFLLTTSIRTIEIIEERKNKRNDNESVKKFRRRLLRAIDLIQESFVKFKISIMDISESDIDNTLENNTCLSSDGCRNNVDKNDPTNIEDDDIIILEDGDEDKEKSDGEDKELSEDEDKEKSEDEDEDKKSEDEDKEKSEDEDKDEDEDKKSEDEDKEKSEDEDEDKKSEDEDDKEKSEDEDEKKSEDEDKDEDEDNKSENEGKEKSEEEDEEKETEERDMIEVRKRKRDSKEKSNSSIKRRHITNETINLNDLENAISVHSNDDISDDNSALEDPLALHLEGTEESHNSLNQSFDTYKSVASSVTDEAFVSAPESNQSVLGDDESIKSDETTIKDAEESECSIVYEKANSKGFEAKKGKWRNSTSFRNASKYSTNKHLLYRRMAAVKLEKLQEDVMHYLEKEGFIVISNCSDMISSVSSH